ncbi:3-oxoacyl-[acyl-carrier-protein] reductase FabG [Thalassovita gelatinovora]|uniref:3-oxoacyl-[acyl-carrier-protein] reductase FabG n=1 Tax=Thalassovita gelatinovora TaxID=53501 RepID=A0A0P1FBA8_THAGE|nr:3-oxoacyl-ACP reductase family protein [Thalassovita gelatinovora]QIZ80076.1 3-oxoacyl-ACP reductase FabG [Thalassovita gelatinovora]CUH65493.1 3-oxoacyl-[acyl-carrier-protein] reductase FabG [Thalassovita gelatinovora]SER08768.1 3-oxoacyl-[acyl-carrier protein] reductase [Thalassovita gelatinovora]
MTLHGKLAIVTGGSRGIGRAIALALASHGAKVAFCHPGDPAAADTLTAIKALSDGIAVTADVADEAQIEAFFEAATDAFGAPDILVNNAGILRESPLAETEVADFDRVIAVNLRGTFLAARAFVRRCQTGRIINIASDLGILGREEMAAYTASKGGIIALTRTFARELAPGILVNAIAPGSIETDMTSPDSMSPEQLAKDMATPLARLGQPGDIAAMACYLASPDSNFVTGQCFGVNGGSVMI